MYLSLSSRLFKAWGKLFFFLNSLQSVLSLKKDHFIWIDDNKKIPLYMARSVKEKKRNEKYFLFRMDRSFGNALGENSFCIAFFFKSFFLL